MAIANLSAIDARLAEMYLNQATTTQSEDLQDRSSMLFEHMQMVAMANKMFLKLN